MNLFQGSRQEFEIAYSTYADMLYRLALSYMNHKEDAEDVVQDVFTKYMCGLHFIRDKEQEKAWLIRVTINQCHDALRKRKYRTHSSLDEIKEVEHTNQMQEYTQIYYMEKENDISELMDMIQKLPEKYKSVIILHYLEGYSVEKTSKILKISLSAVKMRLKRSREFLRNNQLFTTEQ
ncbi:MAG: RNA polymerase sigma factor [Lachnospiraceae bacterium]|nr:RNA polymerase sigma factor [Lachnospiraceae bacterium]